MQVSELAGTKLRPHASFEPSLVRADHGRLVRLTVAVADRAIVHACNKGGGGLVDRVLGGGAHRALTDGLTGVSTPPVRGRERRERLADRRAIASDEDRRL